MTASTQTVLLWTVNVLAFIVIALIGFIGRGLFKQLKKMQTKEICQIYRDVAKEMRERLEKDVNNVGKKINGKPA